MKKSNGKLYWYGINGQVLEETDLSGNLITDYVYFGGMRIARRNPNGTIYYFLADRLGNARVLTNSTGSVQEESDYYPFGQERVVSGTGALNNYKYTGHERDTESGLDHTLYASSHRPKAAGSPPTLRAENQRIPNRGIGIPTSKTTPAMQLIRRDLSAFRTHGVRVLAVKALRLPLVISALQMIQ